MFFAFLPIVLIATTSKLPVAVLDVPSLWVAMAVNVCTPGTVFA